MHDCSHIRFALATSAPPALAAPAHVLHGVEDEIAVDMRATMLHHEGVRQPRDRLHGPLLTNDMQHGVEVRHDCGTVVALEHEEIGVVEFRCARRIELKRPCPSSACMRNDVIAMVVAVVRSGGGCSAVLST